MRKTIPFSTSNYNGCGLASKTNQISARHLGLRDLVLQVEDLRFYFAGATTQRLKTSLYTVVRRGSTAIVHCFAPRFYRGCPRFYCSGCDRSSPVFIRDLLLSQFLWDSSRFYGTSPVSTGFRPPLREFSRLLRGFSRCCGMPPRSSPSPRRRRHFHRGVLRRKDSPF